MNFNRAQRQKLEAQHERSQALIDEAARPTRRAHLGIAAAGLSLAALGFGFSHGDQAKLYASEEVVLATALAGTATAMRETRNVTAAIEASKQKPITAASLPQPTESIPVQRSDSPNRHA